MTKEVVELNGKTYDAVTGLQLHDVVKPVVHQADDSPTAHRQPNHTKAHQPQASRILMRKAVKKPGPGLKRQVHVQSALSHSSAAIIPVKHSATQIDTKRLEAAKQVERSHKISRFHPIRDIPVTYAAVPVQQVPEDKPGNTPPVTPPPVPTNKPEDIFEQAIERANSYVDLAAHRKHLTKKARRHAMSMSAGVLALLIIAAFGAYQNSPGLQLKVASLHAGVSTTMPNFTASGFAYNGVGHDQSRLIIGLKDGGKEYQLSEQKTNWTAQEMIDHISSIDESGQTNYATYTTDGYTVYKFGTNQATWVKDGVWYQVNGRENLTDTQLRALVHNT